MTVDGHCQDGDYAGSKKSRKRTWHNIGAVHSTADTTSLLIKEETDLPMYNRVLEEALRCNSSIPDEYVSLWWKRWLWESDPLEPSSTVSMFNACQLYGLLVCRSLQIFQPSLLQKVMLSNLVPPQYGRLSISDSYICEYTVKELQDSIRNIQLEWVYTSAWKAPGIGDVLLHLLHQLGCLTTLKMSPERIDDHVSVEPVPGKIGPLHSV